MDRSDFSRTRRVKGTGNPCRAFCGWCNAVAISCQRKIATPIAGIFLIAIPHWSPEDEQGEEYTLREGFAAQLPHKVPIYLYHSRDDEWVPFAHLAIYAAKIPQATVREFDGRGHQFNNDLSDVAADIKRLQDIH